MIIHVGLPKTGTTFLQKYYFPELCRSNCLLYLGKTILDNRGACHLSRGHYPEFYIGNDDVRFRFPFGASGERSWQILDYFEAQPKYVGALGAKMRKLPALYSNEGTFLDHPDLRMKLLALYAHMGAKVILTVRNPVRWLRSFYLYFSDEGTGDHPILRDRPSVETFSDRVLSDIDSRVDLFSIALGGQAAREAMDGAITHYVDGLALAGDAGRQVAFARSLDLEPVTVIGGRVNEFQNRRQVDVDRIRQAFEEQAHRFAGYGHRVTA